MPSLNTKLASAPNTQTNYVLKATSSTTIGNSLIFDNGTFVGINTTNPSYQIDVAGAGRFTTGLYFNNSATNGAVVWQSANESLRFATNDTERMRITGAGNVGIGTTNPSGASGVAFVLNSGANQGRICVKTSSSGDASGDGLQIGMSGTSAFIEQRENDDLTFATNASEKMRITSSGNVGIGTSSPGQKLVITTSGGSPSINIFDGTSDCYLGIATSANGYANGAAAGDFVVRGATGLSFSSNNGTTTAMRITSGGTVAIGTTGRTWNASYKSLELGNGWGMMAHATNSDGYLASNTYYDNAWRVSAQASVKPSVIRLYDGFILQTGTTNSVGSTTNLTTTFEVTSNGNVGMAPTYNFTTSNAANLYIDSGAGFLYRSTSSLKYKTDVKDYDKGLAEVMQMRPVYYKGIGEHDKDKQFAGLIAEEIHELGLTEFVQYAEDESPDALAYQNMIALLTKAIQEQQAQIEELKALINK